MYITLKPRYDIFVNLHDFEWKILPSRTLHNFGLNQKFEIGLRIANVIMGFHYICHFLCCRMKKRMSTLLHTHVALLILTILTVLDAGCVIGQIISDILIMKGTNIIITLFQENNIFGISPSLRCGPPLQLQSVSFGIEKCKLFTVISTHLKSSYWRYQYNCIYRVQWNCINAICPSLTFIRRNTHCSAFFQSWGLSSLNLEGGGRGGVITRMFYVFVYFI